MLILRNKGKVRIKKWIMILTGIMICYGLISQELSVKKISIVFREKDRHNRKIPVDIYYPLVKGAKDSLSYDGEVSKMPVICFGHGYLISGIWYEHIVDMVVPAGFILMFPAGEAGLLPSHKTLAKDMVFALKEFSKLDKDPSFPLYGLIDTMKCLMGHSMGGGALFLAANLTSDVKTAVALSPYNTRPSAIKAASSVDIPALIFSGSNDCITPSSKHQLPIYNSLGSKMKTYILIKGGTHCQMGVSHPKCSTGEKLSGCKHGISQEKQLGILAKYTLPWLKFHLKGDVEAGVNFNSFITCDSTIEYIQSTPLQISSNFR